MLSFFIRRVFSLAILFIGITVITFFVIRLAPGSPVSVTLFNPKVSLEVQEKMKRIYGLDKPIIAQYTQWFQNILRLNFGVSLSDGRSVSAKIAERLPITLSINIISLFMVLLISIPLGLWAGLNKGSVFDHLVTIFVFIGFALPVFWFALLCMQFFGVWLGWFAVSGVHSLDFENLPLFGKIADLFRHLVLPIGIIVFGSLAGLSRYARAKTVEVMDSDYIRTAYAKGLSHSYILRQHVLRGVSLPVVTILGLSLPGLLGGSVILETIFSIPGMGMLFYDAVMTRDYTLIMGLLTMGALLTLLGNFFADISYMLLDPRIRYIKKN